MITNMQELVVALRKQNAERQTSIMLAVPMFGGMCHGDFALSLLRSVQNLTSCGYHVWIEVMMGDSLIPRARNSLAKKFLDADMDYMMFLDADVVFNEWDIIKLLLADRQLCAASYPRKRLNFEAYKAAILKLKDNPEDWLGSYIFKPVGLADSDDDGMIEVSHAPTGFMLIHSSVFETLSKVATRYQDAVDGQLIDGYDFFPAGPGPNGMYTSEDYGFCNLWTQTGGKIFLNPFIRLKHIGAYAFDGSLARQGSEAL